ncbi:MAG: tetratricopeptide repeat protein [Candidatus Omnitrophica bacterium]|nr:tetratricopeptide repeat protein [Candidatus Omnitrophota bacterium]
MTRKETLERLSSNMQAEHDGTIAKTEEASLYSKEKNNNIFQKLNWAAQFAMFMAPIAAMLISINSDAVQVQIDTSKKQLYYNTERFQKPNILDATQTEEDFHALAKNYYKNGEYALAKECIETAIKLDPENPYYYLTKIYICSARGKKSEGKEAFKKALVLARKKHLGREFTSELRNTLIYLGEFKLLNEEWDFVNKIWFRPWAERQKKEKSDIYQYLKKLTGKKELRDVHIKELRNIVKADLNKDARNFWKKKRQTKQDIIADWLFDFIETNAKFKVDHFRLSDLFEVKDEIRRRNCLSGSELLLSLGKEFGLDIGYIEIIIDCYGMPVKHYANYLKTKHPITGEWKIRILDNAYYSNYIVHQKINTRLKGLYDDPVIMDYGEFEAKAEDIIGLNANSIYCDNLIWEASRFYQRIYQESDESEKLKFSNLALDIYKQAIRYDRGEYLAYLYISDIYYELGQYELAVSYGIKATTANPYYPVSYRRLAWAYYKSRNYFSAILYFKKVIGFKSSKELHACVYNGWGWCNYEQRDYDDAIDKFNEALKLDSKLGNAYHGLGWVYLKKEERELDKAIQNFEMALKLDPDQPLARKGLQQAKSILEKQKKRPKKKGLNKSSINSNYKLGDIFNRKNRILLERNI